MEEKKCRQISIATSGATMNEKITTIRPTAVFGLEQARAALGLAKNCLPREIRLGRLRVSKRAGRYLILGEWILEWIRKGGVTRQGPEAGRAAPNAGNVAGP